MGRPDGGRSGGSIDEEAARRAFENALATYRQDFGTFFLARLLGLEVVAFATATWKAL